MDGWIGDVASFSCGDTSHGKPYYAHMITGYLTIYHKYKQQLIHDEVSHSLTTLNTILHSINVSYNFLLHVVLVSIRKL